MISRVMDTSATGKRGHDPFARNRVTYYFRRAQKNTTTISFVHYNARECRESRMGRLRKH